MAKEETKNPVGRPEVYSMTDKWNEWIEEWKAVTVDSYKEKQLTVKLPTIESLSLFLHDKIVKDKECKAHAISLSTIEGYIYPRGDRDTVKEEFASIARWIKSEQKKRLFEKGLSSEYNASIAKLILSSIHGVHEKTESDQSIKVKMGDVIFNGKKLEFEAD